MANLYCTATDTGKGFFTYKDRKDFYLSGYGQVWVVGDNSKGSAWINRVNGTLKTKPEAQAIVDERTDVLLAAWEALPEEKKDSSNPNQYDWKPKKSILP